MNLKKIILEYQDFLKEIKVRKRDYTIDPNVNYIITGVRRAGKTWFLFQIIKEYYKNNFKNILYVNFEDDRFIDFSIGDFDKLLDAYYELYPESKPVLFLDEIQNIEGWQKFCRRVADQKYRIYITGSNAKMLSSDIATTLGGRFMQLEICPLSFTEYLRFKDISISKNDIFSRRISIIKKLFGEYFMYGGFPEMLNVNDKRGYLHNLFTTVLYNDIIVKSKIRDTQGIRLLIKKLSESTNDELSYNRIRNLLNAAGTKPGTSTVISWIESLKDSFLINEVQNMNYRFSEREAKKKYYFIDNGLLFALGEQSGSKLLETLAFNVLRKQYDEIMFFKSASNEVDFVVPGKALFQVSMELNNETTKNREFKALLKAGEYLKTNNLNIITYDYEDEITVNSHTISIIPIWKLILNRQDIN
jgi:predicted AAA+ superfamily ATPase